MPGAIALAGVFFITVIEMVFSPAQSICRGGNYDLSQKRSSSGPERDTLAQLDDYTSAEPRAQSSHSVTLDYQPHVRDMGPLVGRSSSISRVIHHMSDESETVVRVLSTPETQTHHEKENGVFRSDIERDNDHHILTPEQNQRKETMQVYLLEMGILFHSIFIGMSLSVSIGSEFVILLIAIVFHRELFDLSTSL